MREGQKISHTHILSPSHSQSLSFTPSLFYVSKNAAVTTIYINAGSPTYLQYMYTASGTWKVKAGLCRRVT